MQVRVSTARVAGPHGALLESTSLAMDSGAVTVASGYPGPGHLALALAVGGRLRLTDGAVSLDGQLGGRVAATLRRRVALIDAPDVTEPEPSASVAAVVGEELAMAGARAWPADVRRWLAAHAENRHAHRRFDDLPAPIRLRMLAELATTDPQVAAVVLVMPDRHGAEPADIYAAAVELAATGLAVLVTVAPATARAMPTDAAQMGTDVAGVPVPVEPAGRGEPA